jgi:hypothetical protein
MNTGTEGILPKGNSDYSKLRAEWDAYYKRKAR